MKFGAAAFHALGSYFKFFKFIQNLLRCRPETTTMGGFSIVIDIEGEGLSPDIGLWIDDNHDGVAAQ